MKEFSFDPTGDRIRKEQNAAEERRREADIAKQKEKTKKLKAAIAGLNNAKAAPEEKTSPVDKPATEKTETDKYYKKLRVDNPRPVYETQIVRGSPDLMIPDYYFAVTKSPKSELYHIILIQAVGPNMSQMGMNEMIPIYISEQFRDGGDAKKRADELAKTGVEWQQRQERTS